MAPPTGSTSSSLLYQPEVADTWVYNTADNTTASSTVAGKLKLSSGHGVLEEEARLVESFQDSLLSGPSLDKKGFWTLYGGGRSVVLTKPPPYDPAWVMLTGTMAEDDLYCLDEVPSHQNRKAWRNTYVEPELDLRSPHGPGGSC